MRDRRFDNEDACKAFALLELDGVEIKKTSHVKGKAKYLDVEIYLHSSPDGLGGSAMKHVLEALSNKNIFDAD